MNKITVWFIKCALVYLVLAALLGMHMASSSAGYYLRPVHTHLNLLGWMSMIVYGVAYHILPRFSGNPLWSERMSLWHLWLANIGLIGMSLGWVLPIYSASAGFYVLSVFSVVEGVSIALFAINMFKTIKAMPPTKPMTPA